MRIPERIIEELYEKVRIEDVVGDYVTLQRRGDRYWGLCPFHNEKTPSFTVTPDKGLYYCFGCHKGGNMFSFLMDVENLSFTEAAERIAEKAGIRIEAGSGEAINTQQKALQELYNRVAGSFHYILKEKQEGKSALEYLERRGISEESIERYQLGWAPSDRYWLYRFLHKKKYSDQFLAASGLFSKRDARRSLFSGRIMFPITKAQGQTIAFGGRTIANEEPKYINSPESSIFKKREQLYGLSQAISFIRKQKTFVLAEGYLDVIVLSQAGIQNGIAPLGTSLTTEQVRYLRRYAEHGVILFDGDDAGVNAAKKAIYLFEKEGIDCNVSTLEEDEDPADIFLEGGAEALQKVVNYPVQCLDFLLKDVSARNDLTTLEGREQAAKELYPYLQSVQSEVKRDASIRQIADTIQVEPRSLWQDYFKQTSKERTRPQGQLDSDNRVNGDNENKISTDLYLMIAVIENHDYFTLVRNSISPEDLVDKNSRKLFYLLEDAYRKGENSLNFLLERLANDPLKNIILERVSGEEFKINQDQLVKDSIREIRKRKFEEQRTQLVRKLKKLDRSGEQSKELTDLQAEIMYVNQELEKLKKMKG
jgi:DNA primase